MKVTGIGLLLIGVPLLLFAGVSHFALAPNPDDLNAATPSAPIFSPAISAIVAVVAMLAGFLILRFGGRGYNEQSVKPAAIPQR